MRRALPAALLLFLLSSCSPRENPQQILATYGPKIMISNQRMSSAENFAKQTVYYMDATVKNSGDRTVTLLEAEAVYRDIDNQQPIYKNTLSLINERRTPLGPGESRDYRVGFEGVPDTWNRAAPGLTLTRIELK